MFIQTESTPNPATMKFIPGSPVMTAGTADFRSAEEAAAAPAPLAERLFEVGGVAGVFLGPDFVAITHDGSRDWTILKPLLLSALMDHFLSGAPAVAGPAPNRADNDDDVVRQIKEVLRTRILPAVVRDGGDVVFRDFKDGVVRLSMRGACSGCPNAEMTLKQGIENVLRHFVPEVKAVEAVL